MKHRSIIGFVLVAAALFAAPQMARDLLSLKSAVGARIRGEIVHAILSVSKGDGSDALMARRTKTTSETNARVCEQAQVAPKPKKAEARATADARPAAPSLRDDGQLAMLVSPSLLTDGAGAETSDAGDFDEDIVVRSPKLPRETPTQVEVAALAPRDAVAVASPVPAPAPASAQSFRQSERGRERESREMAAAQNQLSRLAVDIQTRKVDAQAAGAEILRRLAPAIPASYEFRVEGTPQHFKFVRIRRCVGKDKSVSVSYTQNAARQIAKCSTEIPVPQAPPAE
ncbi:MAG TPA: hypothetical protein VFA21_09620 [Pyrinomonadaceae bacterium]|nr:hypothetical protein [Pyrinomonadaceae bacterium]